MPQANQLALAVGTSEDDVNTFQTADWTDGTANFSVCSTRAVDAIFDYFGAVDTSDNALLEEAYINTVFVMPLIDEATGEVSMTVITIVLLVAVLGIGMFLFGSKDSVGRKWIENTFNNITNKGDNAMDNMG